MLSFQQVHWYVLVLEAFTSQKTTSLAKTKNSTLKGLHNTQINGETGARAGKEDEGAANQRLRAEVRLEQLEKERTFQVESDANAEGA